MTLGEWMDQWVTMRSAILRPRTIDSYRSLLRLYIDPAIGRRKLKRVKPEHIQAMLSAICADGKTRSAELCFVLLSAALTDAVRCRRLDVSPMVGVQRPKHIQRRPDAWTPEEIRQYLAAIRDDPYIVAWMLALCCGLRRGEICGLRWEDVDYRQHILRIRNQRQKLADGRLIDQPPKSLAGVRDVPVPDPLMQVLRDRARIGGYVVPLSPGSLDAAHRRVVARAGLRYIPLHGLRHTMATNALRGGASMRALSDVLGHSDPSITARVYTHPDLDMLRCVVDAAVRCVVQ